MGKNLIRRTRSIPGLPWWELEDALVTYVISLARVQSLDQMMKDAPLHRINQVKPEKTKDRIDLDQSNPGRITKTVHTVTQAPGAIYLQALNKRTAYKKLAKMMINLYAPGKK